MVGHGVVAPGRHPHATQRIARVGVEAGGQQNQIGVERGDHRYDELAHRPVVVGVAGAGFEGHVQRAPEPLGAADVIDRSRPRIEGVLVERDVQHGGVVVEHPLRAVPVMHVVVDDRDPLEPRRARRGRRHRDAVEQTETHGPIRLGVMPRRTNQGHGRDAFRQGRLDGGHHGAGRQQRHLVRGIRRIGVGVEPQPLPGGVRDAVDVRGAMHPHQLAAGGGARRGQCAARLDPPPGHRGHDLGAGRPLRMAVRRLMLDETVAADQNHGSPFPPPPAGAGGAPHLPATPGFRRPPCVCTATRSSCCRGAPRAGFANPRTRTASMVRQSPYTSQRRRDAVVRAGSWNRGAARNR